MEHVNLETPRLRLRPFRDSDAADVYAYVGDPQVGTWTVLMTRWAMLCRPHIGAEGGYRRRWKLCWDIALQNLDCSASGADITPEIGGRSELWKNAAKSVKYIQKSHKNR